MARAGGVLHQITSKGPHIEGFLVTYGFLVTCRRALGCEWGGGQEGAVRTPLVRFRVRVRIRVRVRVSYVASS